MVNMERQNCSVIQTVLKLYGFLVLVSSKFSLLQRLFSLQELEEFVQSSGKDGVVVFTLGSMIKNLTEEKSNLIASALAQIPQKVG